MLKDNHIFTHYNVSKHPFDILMGQKINILV